MFTAAALAAAGQLDNSFSGDGKRLQPWGASFDDDAESVSIQADGRIVAAGFSNQSGPAGPDMAIARYMPNGGLDQSFSGDGKRLQSFNNDGSFDAANDMAIQPNGRIVVAGVSDQGGTPGSGQDFAIARYMPDGSLDQSFSGDGKRLQSFNNGAGTDVARGVAIQPDGRIVVAGFSDQGSPDHDIAVARYMPDGSLDQSFSGDGKRLITFSPGNDQAYDVALQPNGRIVVAGFSNPTTVGDFAIARLTAGGQLDDSFSQDGKRVQSFDNGAFDDEARAIAIQGDGRILVAGESQQGGTTAIDFAIARYKSNGQLDTSFSGDGKRLQSFDNGAGGDEADGAAIQPNGRIVVVGNSSQGAPTYNDFAIARYMPNGSLDQSFAGDGKRVVTFGPNDKALAVALQADGRVVVGGFSDQGASGEDWAIVRLLGS
jgi:uncharacterized delta-60 repeat protein